jgi:hypothetical protein
MFYVDGHFLCSQNGGNSPQKEHLVTSLINILKFWIKFIIISKILDFFKNGFEVATIYGFKVEIIKIIFKIYIY